MKLLLSFCLLISSAISAFSQLAYPPSILPNPEREHIVNKIINELCPTYDKNKLRIQSKVNDTTQVVKVYNYIFIKDDFEYDKGIESFLSDPMDMMSESYLFNGNALIGMTQMNYKDSCRTIFMPASQHKRIFKLITPFLRKINLNRSAVFTLLKDDILEPEVCILTDNKVYVIKHGKLEPFNEYFRKNYDIKMFKKIFKRSFSKYP